MRNEFSVICISKYHLCNRYRFTFNYFNTKDHCPFIRHDEWENLLKRNQKEENLSSFWIFYLNFNWKLICEVNFETTKNLRWSCRNLPKFWVGGIYNSLRENLDLSIFTGTFLSRHFRFIIFIFYSNKGWPAQDHSLPNQNYQKKKLK